MTTCSLLVGYGGPIVDLTFFRLVLTKTFFISTTADRTTFSTDTTALVTGANLSVGREGLGAAGNSSRGIYSGGSNSVTADRCTYSSETTAAVPGANLTSARQFLAAAGDNTKGFFTGGSAGGTTNRTTYSSETTSAVSSANMAVTRVTPGAIGNDLKGFFAGGGNGVVSVDRITYATETAAAVSGANLSQGRYWVSGTGNIDKGFISGGHPVNDYAAVATANRIEYATETGSAVGSANLTRSKGYHGASGDNTKGYYAGGNAPSGFSYNIIADTDRTIYATETTAAVSSANLSSAKGGLAGP